MKHFICRLTGEVFAYEADGSQDEYIREGLEPISDEDLTSYRAELAEQQADIPADIASRRYAAEIGGTTFNGIRLDTTRDGQGLIAGAAVSALIDPTYSLEWKVPEAPGGRVSLSGTQVLAVASAIRAHVQACFNREFVLSDALAAGTFTRSMLEEGWPE